MRVSLVEINRPLPQAVLTRGLHEKSINRNLNDNRHDDSVRPNLSTGRHRNCVVRIRRQSQWTTDKKERRNRRIEHHRPTIWRPRLFSFTAQRRGRGGVRYGRVFGIKPRANQSKTNRAGKRRCRETSGGKSRASNPRRSRHQLRIGTRPAHFARGG